MKISVLIPSRQNPENLVAAVNSIMTTFSGKNDLEVLLLFDDDDKTHFQVKDYYAGNPLVKIYEAPSPGYWKLYDHLNFLGNKATGSVLFFLTDKCLLKTQNWDVFFEPYDNKFWVSYPFVEWIDENGEMRIRPEMLFIIVPKMWYTALGKISNTVHADSFVLNVMQGMSVLDPSASNVIHRCLNPCREVIVEHDRRKQSGVLKVGQSTYDKEEEKQQRWEASKTIYAFLTNNPNVIP